jgi:hypothetical protein
MTSQSFIGMFKNKKNITTTAISTSSDKDAVLSRWRAA